MTTQWWLSLGLDSLHAEVNARWPNRDTSADGTIGDAAHQARDSDHNPLPDGEVCAWDITADSFSPWLAQHLATLSEDGDRRIKYVIWDGQIYDRAVSLFWRPYSGPDPHTSHIHLSVYPNSPTLPAWGVWPIKGVNAVLIHQVAGDPNRGPRLVDQNAGKYHGVTTQAGLAAYVDGGATVRNVKASTYDFFVAQS